MHLSEEIHQQLTQLSGEGDCLLKEMKFSLAKEKYLAALHLLPGDHRNWRAATWLYTALGDAHFRLGNFDKAFRCYFNAVQCPDGIGNPYIHLRLGQTYFESKNFDKAADELTRAYMGGGIDIFMEDDPKYLDFLERKIKID